MVESIALFEQIINYDWFNKTSFILFLNKVDLLKEKVGAVCVGRERERVRERQRDSETER